MYITQINIAESTPSAPGQPWQGLVALFSGNRCVNLSCPPANPTPPIAAPPLSPRPCASCAACPNTAPAAAASTSRPGLAHRQELDPPRAAVE